MGKKPSVSIELSEYPGRAELALTELSLKKYSASIVDNISKFFNLVTEGHNKAHFEIMDFGAGSGTLADIWTSNFSVDVVCIEIDNFLLKILRDKNYSAYENLKVVNREFEYIYTSNVLEHIENDSQALGDLFKKLSPGGKLAIYVPALPILFSGMDRKVGHFRRYRKSELENKLKENGFIIQDIYYNDCIGVLMTLLYKIFESRMSFDSEGSKTLKFYDTFLFPISKLFDNLGMRKLVGKNLFVFATKPNT